MRRISIVVTSLAMALSGLVFSPAKASAPADGTYACGDGTYKITTVESVTTFSDAGTCTGDLVIPEGVTATKMYAFNDAPSQVTSISLPASLNVLGFVSFYGTGSLTAFNVASTNVSFTSVDGVLFSLDGASATLFAYPANKVGSTYTTPTSVSFAEGSLTPVTKIDYYAFQASKNLTTLNISEGVTTIQSGIAESATLLSAINLPNSYTQMIAKPFSGASGITSLHIGKFLTSIEPGAFYQTGNLNSITVDADNPNYSARDGVLFDNGQLNQLKLHTYPSGKNEPNYIVPDDVTHIESSAFNSTKVKTLSIPKSVSNIGLGVFENASALTSFTVAGDNDDFSAIAGVLFNKPPTKLIAYPIANTANTYAIPSGAEIIGNSAFMSASNLTSVVIPSSVSTFENSAFFCATSLTKFYFLGNAPTSDPLTCLGGEPKAYVKNANASSFTLVDGKWNGLTVAISYTLTYTYNSATGGNTVASSSFATGDTPITLPTPSRTGYTFGGWYSNTGLTTKIGNAGANYSPTGTTFELGAYAKWTKNVKAAATVKPTVSGTAKVGKTLTAKSGTWTGSPTPSVTRQWYACKTAVTAARSTIPSNCSKISGATKSTLKLASAQKGKWVTVLVTGTSTGTTKTTSLAKSTGKVG